MKKAQPDVEFVASRRRRWARSKPAPWRRRWPTPSPMRFFLRSSVPSDKFVPKARPVAFQGQSCFNLLAGEPEYLDPLKEDTPAGGT